MADEEQVVDAPVEPVESEPVAETPTESVAEAAPQAEAEPNYWDHFKGLPQFEWVDDMAQRLESTIDLGYNMSSIIEYEYNPDLKGYKFIKNIFRYFIFIIRAY